MMLHNSYPNLTKKRGNHLFQQYKTDVVLLQPHTSYDPLPSHSSTTDPQFSLTIITDFLASPYPKPH